MPPPIKEEWMIMNFQSVNKTRERESQFKTQVYDKINSIHGYVSSCALANRGDVISKLVAAGKKDFTAGFGTERVPIVLNSTNSATVKDAVSNIRNMVASYVTNSPLSSVSKLLNPSTIVDKLTSIIGSPKQAGISLTSAANFEISAIRDFSKGWVPLSQSLATLKAQEEDCEEEEDVYEDCEEEVKPVVDAIKAPVLDLANSVPALKNLPTDQAAINSIKDTLGKLASSY
ncbi:hypothetical protein BDF19DRAFT_438625 [Syncephalis fuscata]|nr:hypothetical protein BDF19DRAFT_438625 [Syncephalis fuscata]